MTLINAVSPKGYIKFQYRGIGEGHICPNCKKEILGFVGSGGGFQDREAKMINRAMNRLEKRGLKNSYDSLCVIVDGLMLKEHPSRYGEGYFMCCNVKIWHDLLDDEGHNGNWNYYYLPTGITTLERFF